MLPADFAEVTSKGVYMPVSRSEYEASRAAARKALSSAAKQIFAAIGLFGIGIIGACIWAMTQI